MAKINKDIKISENNNSGLSEFIKRPLPTDKEVEEFEEIIEEEVREEEIEDSLSEIYQDDNGDVADVRKLDIKKKRGIIFSFLGLFFLLAILISAGYGAYYFIYGLGSDAAVVELSIKSEEKISVGEEFFYTINYNNLSNVTINNVSLEVSYPENFIFLDSSPAAEIRSEQAGKQIRNSFWQLDNLTVRSSGSIKIKGKIINKEDTQNILLAKMTYTPDNFSSEFKKEISYSTLVDNLGIDFNFNYSSAVLVGEENEIVISLEPQHDNFLTSLKLVVEPLENMEFIPISSSQEQEGSGLKVVYLKPGIWQISNLGEEEQKFKIKYKFTEKAADSQEIILRFGQPSESGQTYVFLEKEISVEVMKSDLNLTLIINGSKNDQPIDFEQTLNYSIAYNNKGETSMKDVVIMAVLESDFLDWQTLKDKNQGREKGNTITWSKEEIPALEELRVNEEGVIDFSIMAALFREADLGRNFLVKSYAQFSIGDIDDRPGEENNDNRSNTIINKINSDLTLKQEIRYFNKDNIPVGSGPLPPQVGEVTSFKVYWSIINNLHELRDAQVEVILPDYIKWDNKNRSSVGSVNYDNNNHRVIWQIGRLPTTIYRADAEFNISITPTEVDKNKIIVLLPGSTVQAVDNETEHFISKTTATKTTKLEDDEIAVMSSDGRVE